MKTILYTMAILISQSVYSQADTSITKTVKPSEPVYRIKNGIDLPVTAASTAYTLYGFSKIYAGKRTPEAVILALNPNDLNSLDRPVTKNHSQSAKDASDMLFYGSMPLPLIFLLDNKMRKDGMKIGLLYLQAASVFGSLYSTGSMIARRFRPYTYNPEVAMSKRTGGGGRNSFPSGHPGFVATSTFFMAKVYSDYHPSMKNKWILYTVAGSISLATGILRIKAGEHFITDVMVGLPLGALTGILVPEIHKNKKNNGITIMPVFNAGKPGIYALWKLK